MPDERLDTAGLFASTLRAAADRLARRETDEAARLYETVIEEAAASPGAEGFAAEALLRLGWIDEAAGRSRQAGERFAEAEAMGRRVERHDLAVEARIGIGVVKLQRRDIPKAVAAFEAAVLEAGRRGRSEALDRARAHLAHARDLAGEHDAAEADLAALLERLEAQVTAGGASPAARETCEIAATRLAALRFRARRNAEAEETIRRVLALSGDAPETPARAELLRYLGILRSARGAYAEATDAYGRALEILKRTNHVPTFARLYASAGRSAYLAGDLGTAESHFRKARQLAEALGLRSNVAEFASMLGHIAFRREEYETALALYAEDLEITRGLADKLALGYARRNLGAASVKLGRLGLAAGHLAEAERLFRDAGSLANLALVHVIQGEMSLAAGDTKEARTRAEAAERVHAELGRAGDLPSTLRLLGEIDACEGALPAAAEKLGRAVSLLRASGDLFPLLDALETQARVLADLGRRDLALAAWAEAAAIARERALERAGRRIAKAVAEADARAAAAATPLPPAQERRPDFAFSLHLHVVVGGMLMAAKGDDESAGDALASLLTTQALETFRSLGMRLACDGGTFLSFALPDAKGSPSAARLAPAAAAARAYLAAARRTVPFGIGGITILLDHAPTAYLKIARGAETPFFPATSATDSLAAALLRASAGSFELLATAAAISAAAGTPGALTPLRKVPSPIGGELHELASE